MAEASRAPSAHNTQPARWRFAGDSRVDLHVDATRRLPIADPNDHDLRIALGAAWEGMALALSWRGMRLANDAPSGGAVASGRLEPGGTPDPLASAVGQRATWRGAFERATDADHGRLAAAVDGVGARVQHHLSRDRTLIQWLAQRADQASVTALREPAYFRELVEWLRLSPAHPGWARDGLNAEAMQLSGGERWMAGLVARPSAHGLLRATGLLSAFAAESSRTRTASAALLLLAEPEEDPFQIGRRMYRLWLALTAAGWSACPMSALADDAAANQEVRERVRIAGPRRLVNVLRLGIPPARARGRLAPRLPAAELLLP